MVQKEALLNKKRHDPGLTGYLWKIKDSQNQALETLQNKSLDEANDYIENLMNENEQNLKYLEKLEK